MGMGDGDEGGGEGVTLNEGHWEEILVVRRRHKGRERRVK